MVADQSVFFQGYFKSEGQLLKFAFLAPSWRAMFTGDPDRAGDIIRQAATALNDDIESASVDQVSHFCQQAFLSIPARRADQSVNLLVCGVSGGEPHLVTIEDPGVSMRRASRPTASEARTRCTRWTRTIQVPIFSRRSTVSAPQNLKLRAPNTLISLRRFLGLAWTGTNVRYRTIVYCNCETCGKRPRIFPRKRSRYSAPPSRN